MSATFPEDLFFYHGEVPPPTPFRYEDANGDLDDSIAGATITAKISIDEATEVNVSCTNTGDGSGTIDWPGTSVLLLADGVNEGQMRIDMEIDPAGDQKWYLQRVSIPLIRRVPV